MVTLVSTDGWEAVLRDAAIRWSVGGNEINFHGDVSVEKDCGENGKEMFCLQCFGSRAQWERQLDGSEIKIIDDSLFSVRIPLPTDCSDMWEVLTPRKVRGRTTRAVSHRVHFPTNEGGLEYIQVTVQVFGKDTTPSEYFDAALTFAKLETYAETVGNGGSWYVNHPQYCECKLCVRQALRSNHGDEGHGDGAGNN